jgi:lambda family phage portal protein
MSTLDTLRSSIARWIAPPVKFRPTGTRIAVGAALGGIFPAQNKRMYASAKQSRLTGDWGTTGNASADSELASSLTRLRSRSRALVRDAAYAKRARVIVVNNVVGPGIGMQAQKMTTRDALDERINDDIEEVFDEWSEAETCHTGGQLHFADFERAAMGQVFEAGECFIREHYRPFGDSQVPYALEFIEPERLADEYPSPTGAMTPLPGNLLRLGIEVDPFFRPVAYWFHQRHQGEVFVGEKVRDQIERVPADQVIHLRLIDRWPQTRGEPWLHAVVRKLGDMDGYSEAEIIAARGAASYMGSIETPEGSGSVEGEQMGDGTQQVELTPGIFEKLAPGEKMNFFAPNRPNSALDPFMRYMLREVAAGVGVSYESLSRDYSQSNYSSSRLALLDDRDLWRMLQGWFIRNFRCRVHEHWVQQAVLSRAVTTVSVEAYAANPRAYQKAIFKPRGWGWIDPTKEVEAYREAVRCGFTTVSAVISATGDGRDLEDVLYERRRELDAMKDKNLLFDTDPSLAVTRPTATADAVAAAPTADPTPTATTTPAKTPARVVDIGRHNA